MQGNRIEELRKKLIGKARKQVQEKYTGKESHVVRAISTMQDLDASFNLLAEHCIEWYGMHFPELSRQVKENKDLLKLIYFIGEKSKFDEKKVKENCEQCNAKAIAEAAKKSMGSALDEDSLKEIQLLALNALNIREEREFLQKFIEKEIQVIAKNFSKVAGNILAARLLGEAGSMEKLAMMPSSGIQLLGAEKALFRHLKNRKAKPPKHGLILMHPLLQKTIREHRGKMARALAGKLSIAAKTDFFGKGKEDIGEKLLKGLENRAKQLSR